MQHSEDQTGAERETCEDALRSLRRQLYLTNGRIFHTAGTSDNINLLVSEHQARISSLNNTLQQKEADIHTLQSLLSQKDFELLYARHSVAKPSTQLPLMRRQVEEAKSSLTELQIRYQEDGAQKLNLHQEVQQLKHQLKTQSELHIQSLQTSSDHIGSLEKAVVQLEADVIRSGLGEAALKEAALKEIVEDVRVVTALELRRFQENLVQIQERKLVALKAQMSSNQILWEREQTENFHLQQRVEDLMSQNTSMQSKLKSEEQLRKMLMGNVDQQRQDNERGSKALDKQFQALQVQVLAKTQETEGLSSMLPSLKEKMEALKMQLEDAENRLRNELSASCWRSSVKEPPWLWGHPNPRTKAPAQAEREEGEEKVSMGKIAEQREIRSVRPVFSPAVGVTSEPDGEIVQDAPKSSAEGMASQRTSSEGMSDKTEEEAFLTRGHQVCSFVQPESESDTGPVTSVQIVEVNALGQFVRLFNTSHHKDVVLSSHSIQQSVGSQPIALYRFPAPTLLPAQEYLTVWAASAKVSHNPPSYYLWRELDKFRTGPDCTTTLCKPNGQVAVWYTPRHTFSAAANSFDDTDDVSEEECVRLPLTDQQMPQEFYSRSQEVNEGGLIPALENTGSASNSVNLKPGMAFLLKRGKSAPTLLSSKGKHLPTRKSDMAERSFLRCHSTAVMDTDSLLYSSLRSVRSDSLPGLKCSDVFSPYSTSQILKRSSNLEGQNIKARLEADCSRTARSARTKHRFLPASEVPISTKVRVAWR